MDDGGGLLALEIAPGISGVNSDAKSRIPD